jgi:two-component system, NarL family, sensor histidine kinase UhpB
VPKRGRSLSHSKPTGRTAAVETLDNVVNRLVSEISLQLEIAETIAASATLNKPDFDTF